MTSTHARALLRAGAASACWFLASPLGAGSGGPGSLAGVWLKAGYRNQALASLVTPERARVQLTSDGKWPPFLPWAAAEVERRIQRSQAGDPIPTTLTRCLPGIPMMLLGAGAYPVQILETPGEIIMLFEELNHFRVIHLDARHPADPDPTYMGQSIGHWEGDMLIVDTVGLVANTPIDWLGTPHSDRLHLIERYRRTAPETLDLRLTIDDPGTFTGPWEARQVFKAAPKGMGISEYICENNRDAAEADAGGSAPERR